MFNLIEKIVTKILNDSDYFAGCMIAFCTMLFMIIIFGAITCEKYLNTQVQIAKIKAGQLETNDACECGK